MLLRRTKKRKSLSTSHSKHKQIEYSSKPLRYNPDIPHSSFYEDDAILEQINLDNLEEDKCALEAKKDNKVSTVSECQNSVSIDNEQSDVHSTTDNYKVDVWLKDRIDAGQCLNSLPTVSHKSLSIKDKICKTLQENSKLSTPRHTKLKKLQNEHLQKAYDYILDGIEEVASVGPFYGLPNKVKELMHSHRGISSLYDWQDECLNLPAVQKGRNLVYSLPTSGGKTLVAEILLFKQLICHKKDTIFILPYVSIVQEKVQSLSPFSVELEFILEEYAGSKGKFPPTKRRKRNSLFVCTIEKAHSLINSMIEMERMDRLGLVVVDELHMLGEGGSRGAALEIMLTKLMHVSSSTQIIGMSATLSNISDLCTFLNAELYLNNFRPVALTEYVKMDDHLFEIHQAALCPDDLLKHIKILDYPYNPEQKKIDPDHLMALVMDVIPSNSCLIFCPTKKNCENVATMICRLLPKELRQVKHEQRKALHAALVQEGNGQVCPVLRYTLQYGIAYHHSGLTVDERKLIEEAYSAGTLCMLSCTSTLAAGVNLPAKRVILRAPLVGSQALSRSQYKQMVGRAGRAGIDSSGESVLVTQSQNKNKILDIIGGSFGRCRSSLLYDEGRGLNSLLLSAVGLKIVCSKEEIANLVKHTLLSVQNVDCTLDIQGLTSSALEQLLTAGLIQEKVEGLTITRLGQATFKGSIDVTIGPKLYSDLAKARLALNLASHLHLLHLITPYDVIDNVTISWMTYLHQLTCLTPEELEAAELIGVSESFVTRKASGQNVKNIKNEKVLKRFYVTLMLYALWKKQCIWEVAATFNQTRGFLQNLFSSASSFGSCIYYFCQELEEFWAYQDLLGNFLKRFVYCAIAELEPLLDIPGVKQGRAKQLFKAGYKMLPQVAHADPMELSSKIVHLPKRVAREIVAAAKALVNEKAEALREEADELAAASTSESTTAINAISSASQATISSVEWSDSMEKLNTMSEGVASGVGSESGIS